MSLVSGYLYKRHAGIAAIMYTSLVMFAWFIEGFHLRVPFAWFIEGFHLHGLLKGSLYSR